MGWATGWESEKAVLVAENAELGQRVTARETEIAEQLVSLGELQKELQNARSELQSVKSRVKATEAQIKALELRKTEALAAAGELGDRANGETQRLRLVLAEVQECASRALEDRSEGESRPTNPTPSPRTRSPPAKSGSYVCLGNKKFKTFDELWTYCSDLLKETPANEDLSEEDNAVMLDLLTTGHPEYEKKMSLTSNNGENGELAEAKSIYVRSVGNSKAYTVRKSDGTAMDFGYRRCITGLKKKAQAGSLADSVLVGGWSKSLVNLTPL